jgi:hypothetical protein
MPEKAPAKPSEKPNDAVEAFDFESVYANNSFFEPSVWDLKVIFGQLEQHGGKTKVDWHTAVTMPWTAAKIFVYFLRINIMIHEVRNGPIKIARSVIPALPSLDPNADEANKRLHEYAKALHADMFGKLDENAQK